MVLRLQYLVGVSLFLNDSLPIMVYNIISFLCIFHLLYKDYLTYPINLACYTKLANRFMLMNSSPTRCNVLPQKAGEIPSLGLGEIRNADSLHPWIFLL